MKKLSNPTEHLKRLHHGFPYRIRRLARLSMCFISALLMTLLISYQVSPMVSAIAQEVPNNISGGIDGPGGTRVQLPNPSNTVRYRLSSAGTLLEITKTADKAAAEPGDVVLYRLLVENNSTNAATPLTVVDLLPRGIQYVENSVQASPANPTSVTVNGPQVAFQFATLAPGQSLDIIYAAILTPDAIRGSGRNVAQASAPGFPTVDSAFQLAIRQGIIADCGTIIGRVFVDKNFDGEQQPGEPGIPNAVVYLDDGNRIITDPDGIFSIANVVSGNRVGALDLSSLPGYTLAPNLYRIGDNSQSRLVRLEPSGLARMNFAVTPTYGEEQN
jgi:uncharacterized repeat protein (TIGR01451 family)